jgi:hypothetical protein
MLAAFVPGFRFATELFAFALVSCAFVVRILAGHFFYFVRFVSNFFFTMIDLQTGFDAPGLFS